MVSALDNLLQEYKGNNYEEFRSSVLLWDQSTGLRPNQRIPVLLLKLTGQIKQFMVGKQDALIEASRQWWDMDGHISPGVKKFIALMDNECRKNQADTEFRDVTAFMRIRRNENSLPDFLMRFNMAKEKCFLRNQGTEQMFSPRVVSSLLLEAAQLPLSDRKVILGHINGDLTRTDDIVHQMRNVIVQASIHKDAFFMDNKKSTKHKKENRKENMRGVHRFTRSSTGDDTQKDVSDYDTDTINFDKVQEVYVSFKTKKGKFLKQKGKWKKNKKKGLKNGDKEDK